MDPSGSADTVLKTAPSTSTSYWITPVCGLHISHGLAFVFAENPRKSKLAKTLSKIKPFVPSLENLPVFDTSFDLFIV
jgi:hypothetical protein